MPEIVELIVLILVAFRVTRFFTYDTLVGANPSSGSRFSVWLDGFAYKADGRDRSWMRGKIGDLLVCHWCLGFHVVWILLTVWFGVPPWDFGVEGWFTVFAVAGGAGVIGAYVVE